MFTEPTDAEKAEHVRRVEDAIRADGFKIYPSRDKYCLWNAYRAESTARKCEDNKNTQIEVSAWQFPMGLPRFEVKLIAVLEDKPYQLSAYSLDADEVVKDLHLIVKRLVRAWNGLAARF